MFYDYSGRRYHNIIYANYIVLLPIYCFEVAPVPLSKAMSKMLHTQVMYHAYHQTEK